MEEVQTGVESSMSRAIAMGQAGDLHRAESEFRGLVAERPDNAQAHYNLAVCLVQQDRGADARASLERALAIDEGYIAARRALGSLLHRLGETAEAERHLRRAVESAPMDPEALNDLGVVLNDRGRYEESSVLLSQALRLRPDFADAWNNLGIALTYTGRLRAARRRLDRALRLRPGWASAHANLGNALKEAGRLEEALTCYDLSLRLAPEVATTRWNRSLTLLHMGFYEQGWRDYEWRWQRSRARPRAFPRPLWEGQPLQGSTIRVHPEQGLGDTLQFVRYCESLRDKGARVVLECPSPLMRLLDDWPGADRVIAEGADGGEFDFHVPLMSLAHRFGTTLDTIPARVPYLRAKPADAAEWGRVLEGVAPQGATRVGLVWQGNPHHPWDRFRSIPFAKISALAPLEGVAFFSLQHGPGGEQLHTSRRLGSDHHIHDLHQHRPDGRFDLADIAAVIENLDVVVTVDTAVAHLAGALGAKVWILVAGITDWRWLQHREDSPWYPTARIFRQEKIGRWRPVIERVRRELVHMRRRDG